MKKIIKISIALILMFQVTIYAQTLEKTNVKEVEVISQGLNVRQGPGVNHKVINAVKEGEKLAVIGFINGWYIIMQEDYTVGTVYEDYVKPTVFEEEADAVSTSTDESIEETDAMEGDNENQKYDSTDKGIIFNLSNKVRRENKIDNFIWDDKLNSIAQMKADEMVSANYFSHSSPSYGTPFKMLKNLNVEYITASENLAKTTSPESAHTMLMASPAHRSNILNKRFNKMGVGIARDGDGYIVVQLFIEE